MRTQLFNVTNKKVLLPFAQSKVQAGFPSPASGYEESRLDINDFVVSNPNDTFYIQVTGNSMIEANIHEGDILVIDKSIEPHHGKIIIAEVDGEFTVKRLYKKNGLVKLIPANSDYQEMVLADNQELKIWGVVTYIIYKA